MSYMRWKLKMNRYIIMKLKYQSSQVEIIKLHHHLLIEVKVPFQVSLHPWNFYS